MDAEIGVRNLADSFRYNALPDIVNALDLTKGKLNHCFETFEDLPEYEKLSMLSIAQAELNYAVNWSFQEARVSMVDSLTASMKWCKFDDEFKEKNGYRLPADPCKCHKDYLLRSFGTRLSGSILGVFVPSLP